MLKAEPGDSLWAFTRRFDDVYVLAAHLLIMDVGTDEDKYHGKYVVDGDPGKSRLFDVDECPGVEPLIRSLSIPVRGKLLGYSFQGHAAVRTISQADHLALANFAKQHPVLQTN